jgi:hypothetical protein
MPVATGSPMRERRRRDRPQDQIRDRADQENSCGDFCAEERRQVRAGELEASEDGE